MTESRRIDSVDLLRGIVMILMALDHTRDFVGNASTNPTNLATTTAALFFTRWITHFCAPTFSLLTGVGAFLMLRRRTRREVSRFLFTRGIWLIVLEFTVSRFLWQFNVDYHVTYLIVLWALGWSMIVLSGLIFLPTSAIAAISIAIIALHNLFDGMSPPATAAGRLVWFILHRPGPLELQRLDQRLADAGVVAADVEHPEAAEQVEVAVAVVVPEVRSLRAGPAAVEPDRAQQLHELRVDRLRVQVERLGAPFLDELRQPAHALIIATRR